MLPTTFCYVLFISLYKDRTQAIKIKNSCMRPKGVQGGGVKGIILPQKMLENILDFTLTQNKLSTLLES